MSSFEEHMKIVSGSHTKTASVSNLTPNLLDKLAQELAGTIEKKAEGAEAPVVTAVPAAATVAEAAPAVVAATDAIAVPQTEIAGGNQAEKEKGEMTPPSKTGPVVASAGDGKIVDIVAFSKKPEAAVEATKTASLQEAEEIGKTMARSYVAEMQKIATSEQLPEAIEILKAAGLLDKYDLSENLTKVASEQKSALDKIANTEPMSAEDLVAAAIEYTQLEKQAADADAFGREKAHELVEKIAEDMKKKDDKKKKDGEETSAEETAEKKASDVELESAIKVLIEKGVIKA